MRAENLAHHREAASAVPVSSKLLRLLRTSGQPDLTRWNVFVSPGNSSCTTVSLQVPWAICSISQLTRDGGSSRGSGLVRNDHVVTNLRGGSASMIVQSTAM